MFVCGKHKHHATRKSDGKTTNAGPVQIAKPFTRRRTPDAIECLKRALLGADTREITINLKLAKLHEEMDESTQAAVYHQKVVESCRLESMSFVRLTSVRATSTCL